MASSCVNFESSSYHLRSFCYANSTTTSLSSHPERATLVVFSIQAIVTFAFFVITLVRYNSINILNLKIQIDAISNTWWIFYFLVSFVRSILNCIKYTVNDNDVKCIEITEWFIGTLEVLMLCLALDYQRKYRSADQINEEIDSFSSSNKRSKKTLMQGVNKAFSSSGLVLSTLALVTWAAIILVVVFIAPSKANNHSEKYFYWIYIGSLSLNCVIALFVALCIVCCKSTEGPRALSKVLLFLAVLLALPSKLPFFVWRNCLFSSLTSEYCFIGDLFSFFDVVLVLNVVSLLFIFQMMRLEYLRLKQECQWAMLNEVHRFSF